MTATQRKTAEPAAEAQASVAAPAEDIPVETESVPALLERAQRGLLSVINNAVSLETDNGLDIVLARQAAEVYTILFGESR